MISKNSNIYKLFNEDCNELMKRMPSQSISLIITDPPYNISQYSTGNIPLEGKSTLNSNQAKAGMNPKTLQYLRIHSDISVTMNVYTYYSFHDVEEKLKQMEEFRKA